MLVGTLLGYFVGAGDGCSVGTLLGRLDGAGEGSYVGSLVGLLEGDEDSLVNRLGGGVGGGYRLQ